MDFPFNLLVLKAFHAQRNRVRPAMAEIGLSPGQPKILEFLAMHGECLQKELAAKCEIEPPTISRLLEPLEQKKLIGRNTADGDRRAVVVSLTDEGRALVDELLMPRFERINGQSLQGFSEEERRLFRSFLVRMYGNLTGSNPDFE